MKSKMIRFVLAITAMVIMACLCSCRKGSAISSALKAYELGCSSDAQDGGIHTSDVPMWDLSHTNFVDHSAPERVTIEFGGKSYTGFYISSSYEPYDNYQTDLYHDEITGGPFSVIHGTTEVNLFLVCEDGEDEWPLMQKNPKETFQDQALRILAEHVPENSLREFTLEYNSDEYFDGFHYYRRVDDVTCAAYHIAIAKNGKPASLRSVMGPESEEIFQKFSLKDIHETIQKLSGDAASHAIEEKLSSIYKDLKGAYQWQVVDKYLVQYEEGRLGLVYDLDVDWKLPGEDGLIYESGSRIAILLAE